MFDWIIVGGGIHGVTIANFLLEAVSADKLAIVDPHEKLLADWDRRTKAVGMKTLLVARTSSRV